MVEMHYTGPGMHDIKIDLKDKRKDKGMGGQD